MLKDTVVIIPALNEELAIGRVLREIPKENIRDIIVVDNGSTDNTKSIAESVGVKVVFEGKRGYGQACLAGIRELPSNIDYVIFIDGDFSDDPRMINQIREKLKIGFDFVLAKRIPVEKGALTRTQIFGNWLATALISLMFGGFRFSDLGPCRGLRIEALKKMQMKDQNFGWTIEMQIKAILNDLKIYEFEMPYKKRIGVSKISGTLSGVFSAGYKILRTIFYFRIKAFRSDW